MERLPYQLSGFFISVRITRLLNHDHLFPFFFFSRRECLSPRWEAMRYSQKIGDAMRVCRRSRSAKLVIVVLVSSITLYLILNNEHVSLPVIRSVPIQDVYDSHPTYEYTSLYRTKADPIFEVALESKLVFLERVLKGDLPNDHIDLIANRTIWQTTSPDLAQIWTSWVTQWRFNNEDWKHKLYTSLPPNLLPLFETVPEIAAASANYPEIQADLTKYLLLWYHGGMWSEIDTWNRVSMRNCQPVATVLQKLEDVSLMVGVDIDEPFFSQETIKARKWSRGFGFGQSTIWAPRRFDPILRKAIVRTISHAMTQSSLEGDTWRSKSQNRENHAHEISGGGMFTDIVLEVLTQNLKDDHTLRDRDAGLERRVSWKKFRRLKHVLWITADQLKENVGDDMRGLSVLPIDVWSSGQSHSGSGPSESAEACVNHVHDWRPDTQSKDKIFL